MAERNYVSWKVLKSLTQSPQFLHNGLPIPPTCLFNCFLHDPFGFYQTLCHWFLYYLPFLFAPASHSYFHLCLVPQSWVFISAIFLIICLLPCPFSFPSHSPRQKSQPQMNHSLPFHVSQPEQCSSQNSC